MPKYTVYGSSNVDWSYEIDANDEREAIGIALTKAEDDCPDGSHDWYDVDEHCPPEPMKGEDE